MSNHRTSLLKQYPKTFWIANTMELFERLAWYGMFTVLAIYLTDSTDKGGLGFSQVQKGDIMGIVTAILYLLPVITGALGDKYGYKKMLLIAYSMLSTGYFMMGQFSTYLTVFMVFLYVAMGAAIFKPIIVATISKATNDKTSSMGFGIYYMMVNIGGFIGPVVASKLREVNWDYVFYMGTLSIVINLVLVMFFFKEPPREKGNSGTPEKSVQEVFSNIAVIFRDGKFLIFLFLVSGFWTMYMQFFFTLPNFIEQWVDTRELLASITNFIPFLSIIGTEEGIINPEMMINTDALLIICFQVLLSLMITRWKPLSTMISGFFLCTIGICITFMTMNPIFTLVAILIFSFGEMSSSPRIQEYIGKIAPPDKIGMYMGYSFLPVAMGNYLAGIFSGRVYGALSDKITFLKMEVVERGLTVPEISETFSKTKFLEEVGIQMKMNQYELTQFLWDKYNPSKFWIPIFIIGMSTVLLLLFYDRFIIGKVKQKL